MCSLSTSPEKIEQNPTEIECRGRSRAEGEDHSSSNTKDNLSKTKRTAEVANGKNPASTFQYHRHKHEHSYGGVILYLEPNIPGQSSAKNNISAYAIQRKQWGLETKKSSLVASFCQLPSFDAIPQQISASAGVKTPLFGDKIHKDNGSWAE